MSSIHQVGVTRRLAQVALLGCGFLLVLLTPGIAVAVPVSGAIFTTLVDGASVNENHYQHKEDVYLDGGPGPNAPAWAAGLPSGDYYFQVTDPSGKHLLSSDHISCRRIHVSSNGVIGWVYAGTGYRWHQGAWQPVACQHASGVDLDQAALGAVTVQLYPYDDTPNPGGVYKVWVTPVGNYIGDPNLVPIKKKDGVNGEGWAPGFFHGFVPRFSKTDNYKVKRKGPPFETPQIVVRKFHDLNGDGVWGDGEPELGVDQWLDVDGVPVVAPGSGWTGEVTDPLGVVSGVYTPENVLAAEPGLYTVMEDLLTGWSQTAAYLDEVAQLPLSPHVVVNVAGTSGELHTVLYGNFLCFEVSGRKLEDLNGNGADDGDPGVAAWGIELYRNGELYQTTTTGADGAYSFTVCLGGEYTVGEGERSGWIATGPTSFDFTGDSGVAQGPFDFLNFQCFGISGSKIEDTNGNGQPDANELGIAGWVIYLDRNGAPYASTETDALGHYQFTVCDPGDYVVPEESRFGWTHTSAASYAFVGVSGSSGVYDFLNFACFDLSVHKYYDLNRDGDQDARGECSGAGWQFGLWRNGALYSSLTTGPLGTASLTICESGSYVVVEEERPNWLHTTAASASFHGASGVDRSYEFGNVLPFMGSLTTGFWKTHTGCMNDGTPVDPMFDPLGAGQRCNSDGFMGGIVLLGNGITGDSLPVVDSGDAFVIFDSATCSGTCVYMLRAQLLAAKLNARVFVGFDSAVFPGGQVVGDVIAAAEVALNFQITSAYAILAKLLDLANNDHDGATLSEPVCTGVVATMIIGVLEGFDSGFESAQWNSPVRQHGRQNADF